MADAQIQDVIATMMSVSDERQSSIITLRRINKRTASSHNISFVSQSDNILMDSQDRGTE